MNFEAVSHFLDAIFAWTWKTSLHASVLIVLVCLIQLAGGKWLTARWRYSLGFLVLARLLLPAVPASAFSIFNLGKGVLPAEPQTKFAVVSPSRTPTTPIPVESPGNVAPLGIGVGVDQKIDVLKTVRILWLLGLTVSLLTVLRLHRKFARRIAAVPPVGDERILSLLESCRNVMGVRRRITAVITPKLGTPAVFGFLKPRLLLPENALGKLDDRELQMIFLHELAHVKRGDVLLNWVIIIAWSLHWFNPLVWLAVRRLRADRELVCDAMVMSHLAADERPVYGNTLIKLIDDFSDAGFCPSLAPVINHKHEIKRRVIMIAQFKPSGRIALLLSAAIIIALCCFTFTRAADKPAKKRAEPKGAGNREALAGVEILEHRLAEMNLKVRERQEVVDRYRRDLRIPSQVAEGRNESSVDPQTFRRLEAERISVESNFKGQAELLARLKELQKSGGGALRKAMLTANYDPQLGKLLEDLWTTETTLVKLKQTTGPDHPEYKSVAAMRDDLDKKVGERIEGILLGLEVKVAATKAQVDSLAQSIETARRQDAEDLSVYRPYFEAKRELQNMEKVRDAILLRILQEKIDLQLPEETPREK